MFLGGKGGVGKTTCACAWALDAAASGKQTLLVSTDPAHSLADVLQLRFRAGRARVTPGLQALELDPAKALEHYLISVREHLRELVAPELRQLVDAQLESAARAPGCKDAAMLDALVRLVLDEGPQLDLIVFDTAPTGHTLQLLTLPEQLGSWTNGLMERRQHNRTDWALQRGGSHDDREDRLLALLSNRADRYARLRTRLTNPARTRFIPVMTPDTPAIVETAALVQQLHAQGLAVPCVLVNRYVPEAAQGSWADLLRAQQAEAMSALPPPLLALPRVTLPHQPSGVLGITALRALDLQARCGEHGVS